jgi:hypothetical protein
MLFFSGLPKHYKNGAGNLLLKGKYYIRVKIMKSLNFKNSIMTVISEF